MIILRLISQNFKITPQNPHPQFLGFFLKSIPNQTYTTAATPQPPPPSPPPSLPPPDRVATIADDISKLTLLEVSDLTKLLTKKLEIQDMPLVSLMMPGMGFNLRGIGGGGGGAATTAGSEKVEEKKEKTVFDLKLEAGYETGAKIKIIKELRTFTDLGLKEAKELVEKAPAILKSGVPKDEAEKIVEKMKSIGAKVVME